MERACDVAVIGAGVVGLAAAAALARAGRDVFLLERHAGLAQETSARNSEVIHAGLYYPEGSQKATLCVEGRERLYAHCERTGVPHRRTGKWVVACDDAEVARLETLRAGAERNGVTGLRIVEGGHLADSDPSVRAVAALDSPDTGVVDAQALARSLAAELDRHAGTWIPHVEVTGIAKAPHGYRVETVDATGTRSDFACAALVNAAGLEADRIARLVGLDVDARGYRIHPCKGDYFALAPGRRVAVSRLVYPLPPAVGLGIHLTLDLAGRVRFGPDAEFVAAPRYDVDASKAAAFARSVQRYLPEVEADWLVPEFAGVRPRLAGPGEAVRDFVVAEEAAAGLPGFVNLLGIESPGLTAALAIGERTVRLLASL